MKVLDAPAGCVVRWDDGGRRTVILPNDRKSP
jgi:hypothetical protein